MARNIGKTPRVRPRLELFEDRLAPAVVFNVTTTLDAVDGNDGLLSLREAVMAANHSTDTESITIDIPAGTYVLDKDVIANPNSGSPDGDFYGANWDLDILYHLDSSGGAGLNVPITIRGAGPDVTIIDGNQLDRVFDIIGFPSFQVTIKDLTIQNGNTAGQGGGIRLGNQLGSNPSGVVLTLDNCRITGNNAPQAEGGGVSNGYATLNATNCIFDHNSAKSGGAISNIRGTASLDHVTIEDNTALAGAGIHNSLGIDTLSSNVMVVASTVRNNHVTGSGDGGGIYSVNFNSSGSLTITDSTLSGNTTESGSGAGIESGDNLFLKNSTVSGNRSTAGGKGGGIHAGGHANLNHVTVTGNSAAWGGGFFNESPTPGAIAVRNSILSGNNANTDRDLANLYHPIASLDHNLIGGAAGLGPLAENGGPTFTHALLPGSPAIDAANPTLPGSLPLVEDFADDALDPNLALQVSQGFSVAFSDGQAVLSKSAGTDNGSADIRTAFEVFGDFTATVDVDRSNLGFAELGLSYRNSAGTAYIAFVRSNQVNTNTIGGDFNGVGNTSNTATLRIRRTGDIAYLEINDGSGSGFQTLQSGPDPAPAERVTIEVFLSPLSFNTPASTAIIDNFTITGAASPATDQRGITRPQGPVADIGAFEVTVNQPPIAVDDEATTTEDIAVSIPVLDNDSDPDGDHITVLFADSETANGGGVFVVGGECVFTPRPGFAGVDTFSYGISDGRGGVAFATATVTVTSVNDSPVAADDPATVLEDSGANVIDVLANDSFAPDTGETLTVIAVSSAAHGSVLIVAEGTKVSYTPASNFNGSDSFTYKISDGHGGTATATVTVTITSVNDPPTAVDDPIAMMENSGPVNINVLANDSTLPDVGEVLTITGVTEADHGSVEVISGGTAVSYKPKANFHGTDSFTYKINDGHGGIAAAKVIVTINPIIPGSIKGQKFEDENGNGVRDGGEVGLDGWTIELVDPLTGAVLATRVTHSVDLNGNGTINPQTERGIYTFENVVPGNYEVREVLQEGWVPTAPVFVPVPTTTPDKPGHGSLLPPLSAGAAVPPVALPEISPVEDSPVNVITFPAIDSTLTVAAVKDGMPEQLPVIYVHGFKDDGHGWGLFGGPYFETLADVTGGVGFIPGSAHIQTFGIQFWAGTDGNPNATAAEGFAVLSTPEFLRLPARIDSPISDYNPYNLPNPIKFFLDNLLDMLVVVPVLDATGNWRIPALDFWEGFAARSIRSDYNQNGQAQYHGQDLVDLLRDEFNSGGEFNGLPQVNFVNVSAGGLDVRAMLDLLQQGGSQEEAERVANVVYAAVPFGGSTLAKLASVFLDPAVPVTHETFGDPWFQAFLAKRPEAKPIIDALEWALIGPVMHVNDRIDGLLEPSEVRNVLDSVMNTLKDWAATAKGVALDVSGSVLSFIPDLALEILGSALNLVKPTISALSGLPGLPKVKEDLSPYEAVTNNLDVWQPNLNAQQFVIWGEAGMIPSILGSPPKFVNLAPPLEVAAADHATLHARNGTDFSELSVLPDDMAVSITSAKILTEEAGGYMKALQGFAKRNHNDILENLFEEESSHGEMVSVGETLVETLMTTVTSLELSGPVPSANLNSRTFLVDGKTTFRFRPEARTFQDLFGRQFTVNPAGVEYRLVRLPAGGNPVYSDWQSAAMDGSGNVSVATPFANLVQPFSLFDERLFRLDWRSMNQNGGREAIRSAFFRIDDNSFPSVMSIQVEDVQSPDDFAQIVRRSTVHTKTPALRNSTIVSQLGTANPILNQNESDWVVNLARDKRVVVTFDDASTIEMRWDDPRLGDPKVFHVKKTAGTLGGRLTSVIKKQTSPPSLPLFGVDFSVDYLTPGLHTLYFRARDLVGNVSAIQSVSVLVDDQAPFLLANSPSGTVVGPNTPISFQFADAEVGVGSASIAVPDIGPVGAGKVFTLGQTQLHKTITSGSIVPLPAAVSDRVGNTRTVPLGVRYDFAGPTMTVDGVTPGVRTVDGTLHTTAPTVHVQVSLTDDRAGIAPGQPVSWSLVQGGTGVLTQGFLLEEIVAGQVYAGDIPLLDGDNLISLTAVDKVGNATAQTLTVQKSVHKITVGSAQTVTGINFGNFALGTITGRKFRDLDRDGMRDAGEPGLAYGLVYLDTNGNGQRDPYEPWTNTDAGGFYTFADLGPGTYRVRELGRPEWTQTGPAEESYTVKLTSGANVPDRDFGNFELNAAIQGPALGVANQTVSLTFAVAASFPTDTFTFQVNWDDGHIQTVNGPSGTSAAHIYSQVGIFTVSLSARFKDSVTANPVTRQIFVQPDADSDGIADSVEANFDGNGDSIPDSQQANVASFPNTVNGSFVTLASPPGTTLANVHTTPNPSPGDVPAGASFPFGFFDFKVLGLASGAATTVQLIPRQGVAGLNTYFKFGRTASNPTPHWHSFLFDNTTGAEFLNNKIILHFKDGQRGDNDLLANGTIVDPGAPAIVQPPKIIAVVFNKSNPRNRGSIAVSFDRQVTIDPGAFVLRRRDGAIVEIQVTTQTVRGKTVATLTFADPRFRLLGGDLTSSSTLTVASRRIRSSGVALDGNGDGRPGGDLVVRLFRSKGPRPLIDAGTARP